MRIRTLNRINVADEEKEILLDGPRIAAALRKKGTGLRAWLVIDASGQAQVVEAGKHAIMRRAGLPARDLRILDPMLSYPSTILGRERAIVINLEHIKAIITAHEILLLNSRDPAVAPFAADLQRRLPSIYCVPGQRESGTSDIDMEAANKANLNSPVSAMDSGSPSPSNHGGFPEIQVFPENAFTEISDQNVDGLKSGLTDPEIGTGPKVLPFEFRALEACLESACRCLESEVRDELEHLLDDDEDMAEMYLTNKLVYQHLDETSLSSFEETRGREEYDTIQLEAEEKSDKIPTGAMDLINEDEDKNSHRSSSTSSNSNSGSKHLDVEELEMLLEAYFVQIDGTLNKLSTLREYVDDTEDYINIMLDDKQNHLLQMGVMLSTATLFISAAIVVTGIFGMNIHIELFETEHAGLTQFMWTVGGCAAGGLFLYIVAIAWGKKRGLLE